MKIYKVFVGLVFFLKSLSVKIVLPVNQFAMKGAGADLIGIQINWQKDTTQSKNCLVSIWLLLKQFIFFLTISPNSTISSDTNKWSTTIGKILINYPITDLSLYCGRFVYRVEKSNTENEIDLFLWFSLLVVSMTILIALSWS